MKLRCLLVLGVGLLLAAGPSKDEAIKKDKDEMQGTWSVIGVTSDGKEMSSDLLLGAKVIFKGDRAEGKVIRLSKNNECGFKIDPTQKLKTIDFVHADGTVTPGIYELRTNKIKICNSSPKAARPTSLEAAKGSGWTQIILYRDR
ncbi:MAG: TIGR03067 domain-containing protein [Planctomycetia bacterium]|nr:TIGR03067 domain-containing protein [Planctomycetia bacterium]